MFLEIFLKIESIPYILKALTLVVGSQKLLIFLSGFTKNESETLQMARKKTSYDHFQPRVGLFCFI